KHKRRTLPLAPDVVALLHTQWLWQQQLRHWRATQEYGIEWRDLGLVFTTIDGSPLGSTSFSHALKRICRSVGLPELAPHELRHTGVSYLISRGLGPKQIQELCGHSSIMMTMNVYGHL